MREQLERQRVLAAEIVLVQIQHTQPAHNNDLSTNKTRSNEPHNHTITQQHDNTTHEIDARTQ